MFRAIIIEGIRLAISRPVKKESRFESEGSLMDPFIINFSDSVCGAGKTNEAIKQIAKSLDNVIYAVPTNALAESIEKRMNADGYGDLNREVMRIDSDTHKSQVRKAFMKELTEESNDSRVVIITHDTLNFILAIDGIPTGKWSLYVDEPLVVTKHGEVASEENLTLYTSLFKPLERLKVIEPAHGKKSTTEDIARDKSGSSEFKDTELRDLCQFINADNYEVTSLSQAGELKKLEYLAYLKPKSMKVFISVTMLAAKFQDTLIYQLWSKDDENLFHNTEWNLRFTKHGNGKNVTLYYLLQQPNKLWISNTFDHGNTAAKSKEIRRDAISRVAIDIMKNEHSVKESKRCLLRANTKLYKSSHRKNSIYNYVSGMPFGLNNYDDINAAVYLQTQMPCSIPSVNPWFSNMGISKDKERATYHSEAYQMVLRCSLRDPNKNESVIIVVGDRGTADYIANQFEFKPKPKHFYLDVLKGVDKPQGQPGAPTKDINVSSTMRSFMSEHLKIINIKLEKGKAPGLMRDCIRDYDCPSCEGVEITGCECQELIKSQWKEKVNELY